MDKHTPTPWTVEAHRIRANGTMVAYTVYTRVVPSGVDERQPGESWLDAYSRTQPEREAIEQEMEANAAFIVEAVNSHASLLSTIKELMEALEKWVEFTDSKNGWGTVHMETTLFFEQAHTLQVGSLGALSRAKSLMEQKP